ncbi:MAG: winged helix-turn-helix transcriptional regulator [Clostridia bacterium]|nr:winged helix-turn-helix transcriptional regulator [Clostridia bacterium]
MDKYMNANMVFSKFSRDYMELKKDLPIRPSEMAVVNIITKRDGDFTPLSIAELLGVSKPMIAAHIAVLEKKGYIYKEGSELDKRSFYVRPTEKAQLLADESEAKQTELLKNVENRLGEKKFSELICILDETQTILDEMKG